MVGSERERADWGITTGATPVPLTPVTLDTPLPPLVTPLPPPAAPIAPTAPIPDAGSAFSAPLLGNGSGGRERVLERSISATIRARSSMSSPHKRCTQSLTSEWLAAPPTASSARAMSCAVAKRSPGAAADARRTMASKGVSSGAMALGKVSSFLMMRVSAAPSLSPANMRTPVSASKSTTPAA